jgi:hypothetical protein
MMKEVTSPIIGCLFVVRQAPESFGVIKRIYHDDTEKLMVELEWISKVKTEFCIWKNDYAYPPSGRDNWYIYTDAPNTPENRLALVLKYGY